MATKIEGHYDVQRQPLGGLHDPGVKVGDIYRDTDGLERLGRAIAIVGAKAQEEHEKAVAANAIAQATEKVRQWELDNGPAAKRPAELFNDGSDPRTIYNRDLKPNVDAIGTEIGKGLSGNSKVYFDTLWKSRRETVLNGMADNLASQHRQYRKDAIDGYFENLKGAVGAEATRVEANWRDWANGYVKVEKDLAGAEVIGAEPDKIEKSRREARQAIAGGALRGWFKEQPNRLVAAEQLYSGNIPDEQAKRLYDSMDPKARELLYRGLLEDSHKLITIRNAEEQARKDAEKAQADVRAKGFFLNPELTMDQRMDELNWMRTSPHVSLEVMRKADEFMLNGGRDLGQDDEVDVAALEGAIRRGEVRDIGIGDVGVISYIAKNNLKVSQSTLRTRIMPMIESRADEGFNQALKWGQAELGVPTNAGVLGSIFKDPIDRSAQFEAELRKWRQEHKDGDMWGEAQKIVERVKKQRNTSKMASLPQLAQQYRDAKAGGDVTRIGTARQALINTMVEAGLVDGLEASRSDFDPLARIDQKPAEQQ